MLAPAGGASSAVNPRGAAFNLEGCESVSTTVEVWQDAGGDWVILTISADVCSDTGSDVTGYLIDNGYDPGTTLWIDANAFTVNGLDSVTFYAHIASQRLINRVGWQWQSANSSEDPWTTACTGNDTTCTIQIHGTGAMYYSVYDSGVDQTLTVDLGVGEVNRPDVAAAGDSSGDADLSTSWDTTGTSSTPISALDGQLILLQALEQPRWTYTQGCDKCAGVNSPNTEPAVNIANHFGDCTDFVQTVIKNYLGSAWNHQKLSTGLFYTYSSNPTTLAKHGYVLITDSTQVRPGDVVVRTKGGSGHAGIFAGWEYGWHPIGWANNGVPARNPPKGNQANQTFGTDGFDFIQKPGYVTKYFRPQR